MQANMGSGQCIGRWVCWLAAGWLLAAPALAADAPDRLTLCFEDQNNYPNSMLDGSGYAQLMVDMTAKRLGVQIDYVAKPWKRCLLEMQQNAVDGVINASFVPERLEMGVYPMRNGKPDISRRMLNITYSFYRLKSASLSWDGSKFTPTNPLIAAQTKFSIIEPLRSLGARVQDNAKDANDVLRFVLLGNVDGAALITLNGDRLLSEVPEFTARLERNGPPLSERANYLMFSRQIAARYPEWVEHAWDTLAVVRESAELRQKAAPLFNRKPD